MNALVGDNGIISQAQNASILQQCAALEEFFGELYINNEFDNMSNIDDTQKDELEKIMSKSEYSKWFYNNGINDYVLYDYEDESGNIKLLKIRLLNKAKMLEDSMSAEIMKNIRGGDANGNEDRAYNLFQDVYGVTKDLKVFYCSDGLDSAIGADFRMSSLLNGQTVVASSSSGITKAICNTLQMEIKDLTIQDLRGITTLCISGSDNVDSLEVLYDMNNLEVLILEDFSGSLKGIQNLYKLRYLYFRNSNKLQNLRDTEYLSKVITLKELYFYNPNNVEVEKIVNAMSYTNYDIFRMGFWGGWNPKTPEIGYGNGFGDATNGDYGVIKSDFSDISLLDKFTLQTKKCVTTLCLNNNLLTSLNGIKNYTSIIKLLVNNNNLNDISALSNLIKIDDLSIKNNQITSINSIEKIKNLKSLNIGYNSQLTNINEVVINKSLNYLYAIGIGNIDFMTTFWTSNSRENIKKLENIYYRYLDNKYSLLFINSWKMVISPEVTDDEFRTLTGNESITSLILPGNKNIEDSTLQNVIKSLKNLKYLNVSNTNLSTFSFLNDSSDKVAMNILENLLYVDIMNTGITSLNDFEKAKSLCGLRCGNTSGKERLAIYSETDKSIGKNAGKIISMICAHGFHLEYSSEFNGSCIGGFYPASKDLVMQLSKLDNLTSYFCYDSSGTVGDVTLDLSKTGITYFRGTKNLVTKVILPHNLTTCYFDDQKYNVVIKNILENNVDEPVKILISSDWGKENIYFDMGSQDYRIKYVQDLATSVDFYDILTDKLESFYCGNYSNTHWVLDCNKLTNCTNLKVLTIKGGKLINIDKLSNCINLTYLTNINADYIEFTDITNLPDSLISLNLSNNNFSNVSFLVNGYQTSNLQEIYLNNNKLENYTTYLKYNEESFKNENITEKTSIIFNRLPKLKRLDLTGNTLLTDFSGLEGFSKNNLIFTKN